MRKFLLAVTCFSSFALADSVLLLKEGWQLVGSSTPIQDMSQFSVENVEEIWHYDAAQQQWLGYSPDSAIQAKMRDHNISQLSALENWHGFWVKSKRDWALTLPNVPLTAAPNNENSANDTIQLKEGWNLISLPVDTVVSADIFKDMTVWKYDANQEWELFDSEESTEDFPRLGHIKNSDGIWVKANADTNISVMQEAAKLHNFASTAEMESAIQEMLKLDYRPYWGIEPFVLSSPSFDTNATYATLEDEMTVDATMPMPTSEGSATSSNTATVAQGDVRADDATGTNLQEANVDESDIVKHNGVNIFYTTQANWENNTIHITTFSRLAAGNRDALNTITFDDQRSIDSLYLVDNKLVVLSYTYGNYYVYDTAVEEGATPKYDTQKVLVDIFNVSDIENIEKVSSTQVEGTLVTSRVVGDNLYLVSNFYPQYTIDYPQLYVEASATCKEYFDHPPYLYYEEPMPVDVGTGSTDESSSNTTYDYSQYAECYDLYRDENGKYYRYDYEHPNVTIQALTPNIEGSDLAKQPLITPSRLYASAKPQQYPQMSTISHITISDGAYKESNSFIGYSSVQYASTNAFYLVSDEYPIYYDFYNYKDRSMIYKFDFNNAINYQGIGSVYGRTINQFALSEYQDILRVATTEGFSWSGNTNNSVYTLAQMGDQLHVKGVLTGLGHEGETLQAVRFMGNKGYLVTYRQTDPLYTIDLSNPEAPQKVGELQVNGYSAYLHPVGEDKLLGIGRDADQNGAVKGLKLELFDISDFAHPTSLDSIIYPESTYSELDYNHKALAYRTSDNLFAFPYQHYGDYYNGYQLANYLGIYQIKDNDLVSYTPIATKDDNGWGQHRGLIFDMNNTTYVSFFASDTVTTKELNITE